MLWSRESSAYPDKVYLVTEGPSLFDRAIRRTVTDDCHFDVGNRGRGHNLFAGIKSSADRIGDTFLFVESRDGNEEFHASVWPRLSRPLAILVF